MTWEAFVIANGWRARDTWLAHVLDQPVREIRTLRNRGVCRPLPKRLDFGELFTRWHGRPPRDDEWPAPTIDGGKGTYQWLKPELALLASLIGRMGPLEIAEVLTTRLRQVTGDLKASRSYRSVIVRQHRLGLRCDDVVGGVTVSAAAKTVGCRSILDYQIRTGKLQAARVGRYLVIPHAEFERWKGTRVYPPRGFIKLAKLRKALGIRSDKLSEWARLGYVPSAIRCNPCGTGEKNTQFGTWYVDPKVARKLLADRRAGRPMPWWGQPEPGNLRITWRLLQRRRHPASCQTCRDIWGPAGAPTAFDDYTRRYPPLAHGAKRHLTRPYHRGLTRTQLAHEANVSVTQVQRAIANGVLRATRVGVCDYITRTDATRWKARRRPTGDSPKAWIAFTTAHSHYSFTAAELRGHIATGRLRHRVGTDGPQRGVEFVLRQQCRELRDELGFSQAEAARRAGVSVARLQTLLKGLEWRPAPRISRAAVEAVIKRTQSHCGITIRQAAHALHTSVAWVKAEIIGGTVRPLRTKWDKQRLYISAPMFRRLERARRQPKPRQRWTKEWLLVGPATQLAGVSLATLGRWADRGEIKARPSAIGRRYHRRSIMTRARRYWISEVRYKRATPPAWLQETAA